MLAKRADDTGSAGSSPAGIGKGHRLPPNVSPDAAAERVLALLGEGSYLSARQLAQEAKRRFPGHAEVRRVAGVFEIRGKAVVRPDGLRQPDREGEFAWLRNPPEWARGKWVALAGDEVVAADESLEEVEHTLRTLELGKRPLVHRID